MIRLKQLFTPVKSIDAEEGKHYIQEHKEGTFTLLDVIKRSIRLVTASFLDSQS